MSIDISAEVGLRLESQIERLCSLLESALLRAPRIRVLKHTKTASNTTWNFLDVTPGGVPDGRVYDVRNVVVAGDDPAAALTTTPVIVFRFAGDLPPDASTCPSNLDLLFPGFGVAVPQRITASRGQFALRPGDHLGIGIKGVANGVNVHVSATALDWSESDSLAWIAP